MRSAFSNITWGSFKKSFDSCISYNSRFSTKSNSSLPDSTISSNTVFRWIWFIFKFSVYNNFPKSVDRDEANDKRHVVIMSMAHRSFKLSFKPFKRLIHSSRIKNVVYRWEGGRRRWSTIHIRFSPKEALWRIFGAWYTLSTIHIEQSEARYAQSLGKEITIW